MLRDEIEPVIGEAVNVIVQISKTTEGRRIKAEIREIQGYENGNIFPGSLQLKMEDISTNNSNETQANGQAIKAQPYSNRSRTTLVRGYLMKQVFPLLQPQQTRLLLHF